VASVDLLQGTLDLLLLKALSWGPMHGYEVNRWIRSTTGEALSVEEGALSPALHRLEGSPGRAGSSAVARPPRGSGTPG
jgi:DNA-binding PadR family transcriptional regulator